MKLYAFPPSPNTWKVRAVAAHLGIPLELEIVDLIKGGSHSPDYLAINPTGRTPTLVDGDFKLWESTAIMQYVASQKPNSLWPNDARTRPTSCAGKAGSSRIGARRAASRCCSSGWSSSFLNLGAARRSRRGQGPRMLQQGSHACSTRIWRSSRISSARS